MGRVHENKKLTMGRRKIEIKKIQKKTSLQVTFTKRRSGLFKKAGELSVLCGSDVSIIVRSPANKVYAFGTPSVECVLHRYEMGTSFIVDHHHYTVLGVDAAKSEYEKAVRTLQEKKMERIRSLMDHEIDHDNGFWWDHEQIEGMGLPELEEFLGSLEDLGKKVSCRIEEMEKQQTYNNLSSTSSVSVSVSVITNQGSMEETTFGGLDVQNTYHIDNQAELQKRLVEVNIADAADGHHAHMKLEDDGAFSYSNLGTNTSYNLDFDDEIFFKINYGNSSTFNDVEAFLEDSESEYICKLS